MRYKQHKYYFQYGLRAPARLLKPRMIPMSKFNLPLESIFQYFEDNTAVVGPSPQDRLFQTEGGRLFIEHVKELESKIGNPRRTVLSPVTMENDYRRLNRTFKPLRKDEALSIMNKNVLVINYNMLNSLYKYISSYKATWFRWQNNQNTFWGKVAETYERFPNWNQYVEFEVPPTVPTRGKWAQINNAVNQTTLELFSTTSHLNAVDLYKWLGENRADSIMSKVPKEAYGQINLLFRMRTHWFTINLKTLDAWRKDPDDKGSNGLTPVEMQARFVRLLTGLHAFMRSDGELTEDEEGLVLDLETKADSKPVVTTAKIKEKKIVDDQPEVMEDEEEDESVVKQELTEDDAPLDLLSGLDIDIPDLQPIAPPPSFDTAGLFDSLDDDEDDEPMGQTLSDITEDDEPEEAGSFAEQLLSDPNVRPIATKAFEMAETGIITHRAMNRAIDDALTFKQLPDPYNTGGTIEKAMVIAPDDLELPPERNFPDSVIIQDKSLLSSKLNDFTKKYVTKVMRKDILSSVVAIQKQGVAIKDYKVEVVRDAMNHYEIHAVTIKPIRGRQTTVRFRIPVVDKDGRFISNGVVYYSKFQRAD